MKDLILNEIRRRLFDEGIPRAKKCLNLLTEEEIWYRPNENSNAMGNLILHLNGNVRQWIISALGGESDIRVRQSEFDARGNITRAELMAILENLEADLWPVLDNITEEKLVQTYQVQGYSETGIAILIHVVEHFSYHVGQMTYFVKAFKDLDTGYYKGQNLDAK
ncbi:MAG: DinB family protein [Bacteroidia bacterium]